MYVNEKSSRGYCHEIKRQRREACCLLSRSPLCADAAGSSRLLSPKVIAPPGSLRTGSSRAHMAARRKGKFAHPLCGCQKTFHTQPGMAEPLPILLRALGFLTRNSARRRADRAGSAKREEHALAPDDLVVGGIGDHDALSLTSYTLKPETDVLGYLAASLRRPHLSTAPGAPQAEILFCFCPAFGLIFE